MSSIRIPAVPCVIQIIALLNDDYFDIQNVFVFQVSIAKNLDFKLLAPRKKITIMLIGNHSAGKSSFVNW